MVNPATGAGGETRTIGAAGHSAPSAPSVVAPELPDLLDPDFERILTGVAYNRAPKLRVHPDEFRWPFQPFGFIDNSKLVWVHDQTCNNFEATSDPTPWGLRNGNWHHQAINGGSPCIDHYGTDWYTSNYSAVNETYASPRPEAGEGWMLQLNDAYRDGQGFSGTEDVIVRENPNWIQYWYNFGDSANRWGTGHEGDWEHIAIKLDASNQPLEVEYSYHHDKCTLPWGDAPRSDGRPVVWLAKGSHGSYPAGGVGKGHSTLPDLISGSGGQWNAQANLFKLDSYSWKGFGGAWGDYHHDTDEANPEQWDFGPSSPGGWRAAPTFTAGRCTGF